MYQNPYLHFVPFDRIYRIYHHSLSQLCRFFHCIRRTFHWYAYSNTWLHYSILFNQADVNQLIQSNIYTNAKNSYGQTPLMLACQQNKFPIVQSLVENQADIIPTDLNGKTALLYSAQCPSPDSVKVADYLITKGADSAIVDNEKNSAVHYTARSGNIQMLKLFHKYNLPLDEFNLKGQTPLMISALNSHFDIANYLVQNGADILKRYNLSFHSVFEHALMGKNDQIIGLLLKDDHKTKPEIKYNRQVKNEATILFEQIVRSKYGIGKEECSQTGIRIQISESYPQRQVFVI